MMGARERARPSEPAIIRIMDAFAGGGEFSFNTKGVFALLGTLRDLSGEGTVSLNFDRLSIPFLRVLEEARQHPKQFRRKPIGDRQLSRMITEYQIDLSPQALDQWMSQRSARG